MSLSHLKNPNQTFANQVAATMPGVIDSYRVHAIYTACKFFCQSTHALIGRARFRMTLNWMMFQSALGVNKRRSRDQMLFTTGRAFVYPGETSSLGTCISSRSSILKSDLISAVRALTRNWHSEVWPLPRAEYRNDSCDACVMREEKQAEEEESSWKSRGFFDNPTLLIAREFSAVYVCVWIILSIAQVIMTPFHNYLLPRDFTSVWKYRFRKIFFPIFVFIKWIDVKLSDVKSGFYL